MLLLRERDYEKHSTKATIDRNLNNAKWKTTRDTKETIVTPCQMSSPARLLTRHPHIEQRMTCRYAIDQVWSRSNSNKTKKRKDNPENHLSMSNWRLDSLVLVVVVERRVIGVEASTLELMVRLELSLLTSSSEHLISSTVALSLFLRQASASWSKTVEKKMKPGQLSTKMRKVMCFICLELDFNHVQRGIFLIQLIKSTSRSVRERGGKKSSTFLPRRTDKAS